MNLKKRLKDFKTVLTAFFLLGALAEAMLIESMMEKRKV